MDTNLSLLLKINYLLVTPKYNTIIVVSTGVFEWLTYYLSSHNILL